MEAIKRQLQNSLDNRLHSWKVTNIVHFQHTWIINKFKGVDQSSMESYKFSLDNSEEVYWYLSLKYHADNYSPLDYYPYLGDISIKVCPSENASNISIDSKVFIIDEANNKVCLKFDGTSHFYTKEMADSKTTQEIIDNKLFCCGILTIFCEIKAMYEVKNENNQTIGNIFNTQTLKGYQDMLETGKFSDMKLIIDGVEFLVHKNILAPVSIAFEKIIDDIESDGKDSFEFKELDNPTVFRAVMEYIYFEKIPDFEKYIFEIFKIANKLDIEILRSMCEQFIMQSLNLNNLGRYLPITEVYNSDNLKKTFVYFITQNFDTISKEPEIMKLINNQIDIMLKVISNKSHEIYDGLCNYNFPW